METETQIESVERSETRNGNTRWVVRDADGKEYTTFRPQIGEQAERTRASARRSSSTSKSATASRTSTSTR